MKRILIAALFVSTLLLFAALPVQAGDPPPGSTCGVYYGAHIAEHAQEGHFGPDHNPGEEHQGFSNFVEHQEEMGESVCP